jgi:hypothetical protein
MFRDLRIIQEGNIMVQIGMEVYIHNELGQKAKVGDKVYLELMVQGWIDKDRPYTITEIRPDGTVVLNDCICQHSMGIVNFKKVK